MYIAVIKKKKYKHLGSFAQNSHSVFEEHDSGEPTVRNVVIKKQIESSKSYNKVGYKSIDHKFF